VPRFRVASIATAWLSFSHAMRTPSHLHSLRIASGKGCLVRMDKYRVSRACVSILRIGCGRVGFTLAVLAGVIWSSARRGQTDLDATVPRSITEGLAHSGDLFERVAHGSVYRFCLFVSISSPLAFPYSSWLRLVTLVMSSFHLKTQIPSHVLLPFISWIWPDRISFTYHKCCRCALDCLLAHTAETNRARRWVYRFMLPALFSVDWCCA
jgi:hypothetical protein